MSAQSILLYQQLARVIGKLASSVEIELQKQMHDLGLHLQQTGDKLNNLSPQIDRIKDKIIDVEQYVFGELSSVLRRSTEIAQGNMVDAESLQRLLTVLLRTVLQTNAEVAAHHEKSLELATTKANENIDGLMSVIGAAFASAMSLHDLMVCDSPPRSSLKWWRPETDKLQEASHNQAVEMAHRQDKLEQVRHPDAF
jgi:hypothetical protein